jgi:hypothetical protein
MPCTHAARAECCGRTDCASCGRKASADLRAAALLSPAGVMALAREVVRVEGSGSDDAVNVADLAASRGWRLLPSGQARDVAHREALAWAEGVVDELRNHPGLMPGDYGDDADERAAYTAGRRFASAHSTV